MNTAEKRKAEPLPMSIDSSEFSRLLSNELAGKLEDLSGQKQNAGAVEEMIETALLTTLHRISPSRRLYIKTRSRARGRSIKALAPAKVLAPLPVEDLKPSEVIERGLVEMSLSQLYRATTDGRFYCSVPRGRSHGKLYPSWQFVEPVPSMLPDVLRILKEKGERYVHARMVSGEDELNELSPAEMLAGRPFSVRADIHPMQTAMLNLPTAERLALVTELFELPSREHSIG